MARPTNPAHVVCDQPPLDADEWFLSVPPVIIEASRG
jgi:hypothetical protein